MQDILARKIYMDARFAVKFENLIINHLNILNIKINIQICIILFFVSKKALLNHFNFLNNIKNNYLYFYKCRYHKYILYIKIFINKNKSKFYK